MIKVIHPEFLTVDDVIEIHKDLIDTYGGSHGIRDRGLLESAIEQPQSSFDGEHLHKDLVEMGASSQVSS